MLDGDEIINIIAFVALVLLPSIAITTRLALRPIVDALLRLREGFPEASSGDDERIAKLEADIEGMQAEIDRLTGAESFYRELATRREARTALPDGE